MHYYKTGYNNNYSVMHYVYNYIIIYTAATSHYTTRTVDAKLKFMFRLRILYRYFGVCACNSVLTYANR